MPILKSFKTEGGATVTWHRISKVESSLLDSHAVAVATVHSWPDLEAFIETEGGRFTWTSYIPIPLALIDGADFLGSCERALTELAESLFFGGSVAPMPNGLELARELRWSQMKQMRSIMASRPIAFEGSEYDADASSVANIIGSLKTMEILGQTEKRWTLADNSVKTLTIEQLSRLGAAIGERTDQCYEIGRGLRERIFDPVVATVEELLGVSWPRASPPAS